MALAKCRRRLRIVRTRAGGAAALGTAISLPHGSTGRSRAHGSDSSERDQDGPEKFFGEEEAFSIRENADRNGPNSLVVSGLTTRLDNSGNHP